MLKVFSQGLEPFHNFKCGEIFCVTSAVFRVSCCLCSSEMHMDEFSNHFQIQHLSLVEECIYLEDVETKPEILQTDKSSSLEQNPIKIEIPPDDALKKEKDLEFIEEVLKRSPASKEGEVFEDNHYMQDDLIECITKEKKLKNITDNEGISPMPRKRSTRNSNKTDIMLVKDEEFENLVSAAFESNETTVSLPPDANTNEEDNNNIEENEDLNIDMPWSANDNTFSDSDSNVELDSKDELPFPCLICKLSYRTKHSLQKHNHRVHNPNKSCKKSKAAQQPQHKCDECDQVFRSARDLQGHKWKHTGIFCDICGRSFSQTGNLLRHKIRHTGIKDFKCEQCQKDFFTAKELKSHMICHTGRMPMICEICGKRCRDKGVLTAHMRRHTGERPAKCEVCGKCFFSIHDLNVHAVAHTDARPFKCDICNATFQRKKALRIHKLIHSKDRKHVCKICGKGFAQSGGLNSHMRTHDAAWQKSASRTVDLTTAVGHISDVAIID